MRNVELSEIVSNVSYRTSAEYFILLSSVRCREELQTLFLRIMPVPASKSSFLRFLGLLADGRLRL
jgi:hypothetical protein